MKQIITLLLLTVSLQSIGQNLVRNPGFEDSISCPPLHSYIDVCRHWHGIRNTPDYYHPCSSDSNVTPPDTYYGHQQAYEGKAFTGIYTYDVGLMAGELITAQLSAPLETGQEYDVSFYINRAFYYHDYSLATNNMGALFTMGMPYYLVNGPLPNYAHVYNPNIIKDTTGWVKIEGSFVADSNYQYIVLGNLFDFQHTDTVNDGAGWRAYYFIDGVSVTLHTSTSIANEPSSVNSASVVPNPFSTELSIKNPGTLPVTICIYTPMGQTVLQQTFIGNKTLNTEQFTPGIYFYELRKNTGVFKTGKAVKY